MDAAAEELDIIIWDDPEPTAAPSPSPSQAGSGGGGSASDGVGAFVRVHTCSITLSVVLLAVWAVQYNWRYDPRRLWVTPASLVAGGQLWRLPASLFCVPSVYHAITAVALVWSGLAALEAVFQPVAVVPLLLVLMRAVAAGLVSRAIACLAFDAVAKVLVQRVAAAGGRPSELLLRVRALPAAGPLPALLALAPAAAWLVTHPSAWASSAPASWWPAQHPPQDHPAASSLVSFFSLPMAAWALPPAAWFMTMSTVPGAAFLETLLALLLGLLAVSSPQQFLSAYWSVWLCATVFGCLLFALARGSGGDDEGGDANAAEQGSASDGYPLVVMTASAIEVRRSHGDDDVGAGGFGGAEARHAAATARPRTLSELWRRALLALRGSRARGGGYAPLAEGDEEGGGGGGIELQGRAHV